MTGLAAIAISLLVTSPLAPGAVDDVLFGHSAAHLRLAGLSLPLSPIPHGFHGVGSWNIAFFDPVDDAIWLSWEAYVEAGRLRSAEDLQVDATEYLVHAVAERWALHSMRGESDAGRWMIDRSTALHPELPRTSARQAFLDAAASFVARVASVANEIHRVARRRGQDPGLCRALRQRRLLFGQWEGVFERETYFGSYSMPDGTSRTTRAPLSPADKEDLARLAFEPPWSGDVTIDFGRSFCLDAAR